MPYVMKIHVENVIMIINHIKRNSKYALSYELKIFTYLLFLLDYIFIL